MSFILGGGGSLVAKLCFTLATPWIVAHQAPLSMRFPRQEYGSRLPFLSPGDLPYPGMESASPVLAGGFFVTEPPGKSHNFITNMYNRVNNKNFKA